jgi:hypothetical protein
VFFSQLPGDAAVCPITGITHTLFYKAEIYNQGKLLRVYDNFSRLYVLASLFAKPSSYFAAAATSNGDILDTNRPEGISLFQANRGAIARQAMIANSGRCTVYNRLWLPLFQTEKLIPTKLENLQIHFYLNDEKFGNFLKIYNGL